MCVWGGGKRRETKDEKTHPWKLWDFWSDGSPGGEDGGGGDGHGGDRHGGGGDGSTCWRTAAAAGDQGDEECCKDDFCWMFEELHHHYVADCYSINVCVWRGFRPGGGV